MISDDLFWSPRVEHVTKSKQNTRFTKKKPVKIVHKNC